MTAHFRELAEQLMADGSIDSADLGGLRRSSWQDGRVSQVEADTLFLVNDSMRGSSEEWSAYFVEALTEYVVNAASPRGYVDEARAAWLRTRILENGQVAGMEELELVVRIMETATSVPDSLRQVALKSVERAALQGLGPTRDGSESEAGRITPEETELLRRMLFAPGSERPAGVSKAEAELLFRIKDGTLDGANAADWPQLFVQGVGNFLQGFDGHEPLSAERAVELEAFMNDTGGHIRDFLGRVLQSDPRDGFANLMSIMPHADTGDFDEEVEEAMQITPQERSWLNDMLEADEDLDPLEKQLLEFIAETQDLF